MTMERFAEGQSYSKDITITKEHTTNRMGREGADVLSTPALLGLMEGTCIEASQPNMPEGYTTVGYAVDRLRHMAPTPLGGTVRVNVALTSVDRERNRLHYAIEVFEGERKIAIATHGRAVIPVS